MGLLDLIAPGKKNRANPQASTQTHLRIGEIRDNIVVLKTGGARAVLKVSSINFNLKSEQEQDSIISAYQGFLNSLEFPIQILVRSKKLDIDNYIEQVKKLGEKQKNTLLQEQTYEYADYVKKLVEYADIMEKEFFVVIPFDPGGNPGGMNFFQSFFQRLSPKDTLGDIKKRNSGVENMKKTLTQRLNIVSSGLEGCGLKAEQLDTKGLIQLFYKTYNPKTSRNTKIQNTDDLDLQSSTVGII